MAAKNRKCFLLANDIQSRSAQCCHYGNAFDAGAILGSPSRPEAMKSITAGGCAEILGSSSTKFVTPPVRVIIQDQQWRVNNPWSPGCDKFLITGSHACQQMMTLCNLGMPYLLPSTGRRQNASSNARHVACCFDDAGYSATGRITDFQWQQ